MQQQQQQQLEQEEEDQEQQNLKQQSKMQSKFILSLELKEFYGMDLQKLSNIPYARLYSMDLKVNERKKINVVGQILELKRLRMKLRSAKMNIRVIEGEQNLSEEKKNKVYLLKMIVEQLWKKVFIQTLRMNIMQNQYRIIEQQEKYQNQKIQMQNINQYNEQRQNKQKNDRKQDKERKRQKLTQQKNNRSRQRVNNKKISKVDKKNYDKKQNIQNCEQDIYKKRELKINSELQMSSQVEYYCTNQENTKMNDIIERSSTEAIIFGQIITSVFKSKLYRYFCHLNQYKESPRFASLGKQHEYVSVQNSIQESQQQYSNRHYEQNNNYDNDNYYSDDGNENESVEQKIIELQEYIKKLKRIVINERNNLLKKYFIKWKIYFLQKMMTVIKQNSIQQQQSINQFLSNNIKNFNVKNNNNNNYINQHLKLQHQIQKQQQLIIKKKPLKDYQFRKNKQINIIRKRSDQRILPKKSLQSLSSVQKSRNITQQFTQLSNYTTLKNEKKQLKLYLLINSKKIFLKQLFEYYSIRCIKRVCIKLRKQNQLKKYFNIMKKQLYQNKKQKQYYNEKYKQYYQKITQQQSNDLIASQLMYKTNLQIKTFYVWCKYNHMKKIIKAINKYFLFQTFFKLKNYHFRNKKIQQKQIYLNKENKKKLQFRVFNHWKNISQHAIQCQQRFKAYHERNKYQTLSYCFSILTLGYKRHLVRLKRAQKVYNGKLVRKVLQVWLKKYYEYRHKNFSYNQLKNSFNRYNKRAFFIKFHSFYQNRLEYQKCIILERRIMNYHEQKIKKTTLIKWRHSRLKKISYSIIEMRLIRLQQAQVKRKMLVLWKNKMQEKIVIRQQGQNSENHKDWLIKYYQTLCEFNKQ